MSPNFLEVIVLLMLCAALLLGLYRLLRGPLAVDRIVAADTLSVIITAAIVLLGGLFGSVLYLDVALVYGVLAFVGTVAIARAIEGGRR